MSYAVRARVRPRVVTAASRLLYLLAALQALTFGASFAQNSAFRQLLADESFAQADRDALRRAMLIGILVATAFTVAFITAYILLGVFVGKGKQPARVVTWVIAGLLLLCNICSFAGQSTTGAVQSGSDNIDPELRSRFEALSPGWYETLTSVRTVVEIVALVAIVILLARPSAHDFFRKDDLTEWSPGTYYPAVTQPPAAATPAPATAPAEELPGAASPPPSGPQ